MTSLNKVYFAAGPDLSCRVISTVTERRQRLEELGIDENDLAVALQRGVAEKATAVFGDPTTAGGQDLYRYTTRHIREVQHAKGWEIKNGNNIALVRDTATGTTLIVCAGDYQTGMLIGKQPRTRRSKGPVFLKVSEFFPVPEVVQGDLFGEHAVRIRTIAAPTSKVWLLLHYHHGDGDNQVLRAELSRPLEATRGIITKWAERIILHTTLPGQLVDDFIADDKGPSFTPSVVVNF